MTCWHKAQTKWEMSNIEQSRFQTKRYCMIFVIWIIINGQYLSLRNRYFFLKKSLYWCKVEFYWTIFDTSSVCFVWMCSSSSLLWWTINKFIEQGTYKCVRLFFILLVSFVLYNLHALDDLNFLHVLDNKGNPKDSVGSTESFDTLHEVSVSACSRLCTW